MRGGIQKLYLLVVSPSCRRRMSHALIGSEARFLSSYTSEGLLIAACLVEPQSCKIGHSRHL